VEKKAYFCFSKFYTTCKKTVENIIFERCLGVSSFLVPLGA